MILDNDQVRSLVGGIERLPSLPQLYWELTRALENPTVSLPEVATILSKDVSMIARLLQIVNSAYFSLQRRVTDVQDAVVYLGLNTVRNLVLSMELLEALDQESLFPGFRSIACSRIL